MLTWTDAALNAVLRRAAASAPPAQLQQLRRILATLLVVGVKEAFATSTSPAGKPWDRLKVRSGKPLRNADLLMGSVREAGTATTLVLVSNLKYAAIHQYGGVIRKPERTRGPKEKPWVFKGKGGQTVFTRHIRAHAITIPRREFLGASQKVRKQFGDAVERLVVAPAKKALAATAFTPARAAAMKAYTDLFGLLKIIRLLVAPIVG